MQTDYVIVGAGLTGSVITRHLVDADRNAVVLDRRSRLGGNVADEFHPSGINVHSYGPHLFRTVSDNVWHFVNRFATFHPYQHQIRSRIDGHLENWPVAASYIRRTCGENWQPELIEKPQNFEQAALSLMPRIIYERFVKGYTEKQWGVPADSLSASLCKRFDVRDDDNPYLTPKAKHQGIPTEGYSQMMKRMLAGIPAVLNFDYLKDRDAFRARKRLIFTGPIDEFFGFELGRLAYRGQKRTHAFLPDTDWAQPCGQLNNPGSGDHIRDIEWKHMMQPDYAAAISGTLITRETPWSPNDPEHYEYPFPDEQNRQLYRAYQNLAREQPDVLFCGRLGEYRYLDMDHAIERARLLAEKLLTADCRP